MPLNIKHFLEPEDFKGLIDWKIINFILDKITPFEDLGYEVFVSILGFVRHPTDATLCRGYLWNNRDGFRRNLIEVSHSLKIQYNVFVKYHVEYGEKVVINHITKDIQDKFKIKIEKLNNKQLLFEIP